MKKKIKTNNGILKITTDISNAEAELWTVDHRNTNLKAKKKTHQYSIEEPAN